MFIKQRIAISNQVISDNEEEPTVNARDLHAFLEVRTLFKDWIKRRIKEYSFVQSIDFNAAQICAASGKRHRCICPY